jgi:hypothetical protein
MRGKLIVRIVKKTIMYERMQFMQFKHISNNKK